MTDLYDLLTRNDPPGKRKLRHWECYVEGTDGGIHYKHYSLEDAQNEAERLARLTGDRVFLFRCEGICCVAQFPVEWIIPR